jgi:adenosylmethionine-8-amino-7-oxononanoate aminotransferase
MAVPTSDYSLTASPGRALPVAVHAEGCRIRTADGREYLDACGGAMVMSLGHRHPRLVEALKRQVDELTFTYRFSFGNEPMSDLASLIREIAPMERAWAFFNSSGSESIESAIHMAILYWQHRGRPSKIELISRFPSYHGSTLGALGLSGSAWRKAFELVLEKNAVAQTPNADIRSGRTPEQEVDFAVGQIEDAIATRGAEHVAAVFLEPITGASGAAIVPPDGYMERVREVCDRYEVLLICDETITGFGRTGTWFGSDHWNFSPDIVTFAKGVTSGMLPFSGMAVAGHIADVFMEAPDGFPWGHTFSGYPLGCAVAAEAIRVIRDEDVLANVQAMGARLEAGLREIAARSPIVGQVRGRGLLWGLELVQDRQTLEPLAGASTGVQQAARERGLMIYSCPTPFGRRTIEAVMLAPPLNINTSDIDEIVTKLDEAVTSFSAGTV